MPRRPPALASVTLTALRHARGWTGQELAQATGLSAQMISLYENERAPSRRKLESFAAAMGYGVEAVDFLLFGLAQATARAAPPSSPDDPTAEEARRIQRAAVRVGQAAQAAATEHLTTLLRARRAAQARRAAEQAWARLAPRTAAERRRMVETSPEFQGWGLVERLCHESEEAASDSAARALELAELALLVAALTPGGEAWRSRLLGYAFAFLANARRVGNDLDGAEEALASAWRFWQAGVAAPGPLAAWRLLYLEASLRRDQRRFREALRLLDRARAEAPPAAVGRILMKRASTLEQMGEAEQASAVLREAAPLLDQATEPRLPWVLRFNLTTILCQLERYGEAEALLPEVRELALALGKELDQVRVTWLEGRVAAGRGRTAQALVALEEARREFTARELAYDAALVSLDLAALHLQQRHTSEVRALARELVWIFKAPAFHREALAALRLFCQAAEKETATLDLVRRLVDYLAKARHDPRLRFAA
jgi:transcriptional regulator with XRE-family HTH domain/predicted negative regulator of RcsB-dependent stress response